MEIGQTNKVVEIENILKVMEFSLLGITNHARVVGKFHIYNGPPLIKPPLQQALT